MQKMWDWCMSTMCLHLQQANATIPIYSTLVQDGKCTKRATVSKHRKSVFFFPVFLLRIEIRLEILSSKLLPRQKVAIWGTNPGSKIWCSAILYESKAQNNANVVFMPIISHSIQGAALQTSSTEYWWSGLTSLPAIYRAWRNFNALSDISLG